MHFLDDLKTVVTINSYTRNKSGVDQVGLQFIQWMEALGFQTHRYERALVGNHLYFTSEQKEGKRLLLLGHLDTVFPPQSFETYDEDEHWVYGAGVCDMKGGNIVALEALRNLYRGHQSISNIDFLLVSDEETGSDDSKLLSAELAKNYDYCFVFEAAGEQMEVVSGRKGVGTFFLDIEGKAAHAGNHYTKGADANLELSHKLQALVALTDLDQGTTVNVGKIEGGIGANTISPHAKMTFEIRYKNIDERDRLLSKIDEIVTHTYVKGTISRLSGGIQRDVMEEDEATLQFIAKLEAISGQSIPYEFRGGVSDANIVSSQGVMTIDGFGPFGDGDHTVHERANKQSFIERIDLVTKLCHHFIEHGDFK
jgi:glutamate carboxypeptidase